MKTLLGAKNNTQYASRIFADEVECLPQSQTTDKVNNSIGQSGTVYMTLPYPE